jgi:hypothetical protein
MDVPRRFNFGKWDVSILEIYFLFTSASVILIAFTKDLGRKKMKA